MTTAQIIDVAGEQAIKLPPEFRVSADVVAIRKEGDAIIVEPLKASKWPVDFFDEIRIDDPAFCRPPQGQMPTAPPLG